MFGINVTIVMQVILNERINAGQIPIITNAIPSVSPIMPKNPAMIMLNTKRSPRTIRKYPT